MHYQPSILRKILAGPQLAAAGVIAIALATVSIAGAQTCPPLPAGAVYPPSGTMVAWYPFDETVSPSIDLATGSTVAWGGTPSLMTGEVKGALNFTNGYLDTPSSIITNFGPAGSTSCPNFGDYSTCEGNFSIDAWINLAALPNGNVNVIVDKRTSGDIGYEFYIYGHPPDDGGNPWMGLQLGDKAHGYTNYGTAGLPTLTTPLNVWHHVAVTVQREGSPGALITFYLDGASAGTAVPTQTGSLENTEPMRIGEQGAPNGGGSNFIGGLDELQLFNRVLTATEVKNIFTAGPAGQCKP
jgi:hypothetical protein